MIVYETNYLAHHGVKGMKWGVRKERERVSEARQAYKQARKDASKTYRKAGLIVKNPSDPRVKAAKKATQKVTNAELNYIRSKANLAKAKRGEKGEIRSYARSMQKSGAPGSVRDYQYSNRSTNIYNDIKKRKGKAYADKVFQKSKNQALTSAAIAGSIAIGAAALDIYLASR